MEADPVIYLTNAATIWRKPQPVIEAVHASLLIILSYLWRSDPVSKIVLLGERGWDAFLSFYLHGTKNHDTECSGPEFRSRVREVIRDHGHLYPFRLLSRIEQNNITQSIDYTNGFLHTGKTTDAVRTGFRISGTCWRDIQLTDHHSPRDTIPKDFFSAGPLQVSGLFLIRIPERWERYVPARITHISSLIVAGGFLYSLLPGIRSIDRAKRFASGGVSVPGQS